jgi:hypothetical protein
MVERRTSATNALTSVVQGSSVLAIRIFNILATNIHIVDKSTGKKIGFVHKKKIDKEFEFSEAIRTEDIKAIVEHINQCNRHAYRLRYGKEPINDYIEMKINEDYFAEMMSVACPNCGLLIKYKSSNVPIRVVCSRCGKKGVIR